MEDRMSAEEFASRMRRAAKEDPETGHILMDDLMCTVLDQLGYGEGVDVFEGSKRWYA